MGRAFDTTRVPALALAGCLMDLAALLDGTSDLDYRARPDGGVSGSVGAHVRHCLDHVRAVLDGVKVGLYPTICRLRDTALEHNRTLGILALRQQGDRRDALVDCPAEQPVRLEAQVDCTGGAVEVTSSLGREPVFVLQHTIPSPGDHRPLLAARGIAIPPHFGYAPSTVRRHAAQLACARKPAAVAVDR